jgi:hypothetical protein
VVVLVTTDQNAYGFDVSIKSDHASEIIDCLPDVVGQIQDGVSGELRNKRTIILSNKKLGDVDTEVGVCH